MNMISLLHTVSAHIKPQGFIFQNGFWTGFNSNLGVFSNVSKLYIFIKLEYTKYIKISKREGTLFAIFFTEKRALFQFRVDQRLIIEWLISVKHIVLKIL